MIGRSVGCTFLALLLLGHAGCSEEEGGAGAPAEGGRLYVASGFTDEVFVLDPEDGRVLSVIPVESRPYGVDEPHGIAISPDSRHWYVTLAHGEPTLSKFETAGDRLVGRLSLGTSGAARIGITPDGRRGFIPDYWRSGMGRESRVAVVDLHDLVLVDTPLVCPAPHDAQVDPRGRRVAITCALSDEVVVLDVATLRQLSRFPVDPGQSGEPHLMPMNLAWSDDGEAVIVTLMHGEEVRAFTPEGALLGIVGTGAGPTQIVTIEGGRALVTNRGDRTFSLIDVQGFREISRIALPEAPHPQGVAYDPVRGVVFVGYEGSVGSGGGVLAVRVATGELLWRQETGVFTLGIALLPASPDLPSSGRAGKSEKTSSP